MARKSTTRKIKPLQEAGVAEHVANRQADANLDNALIRKTLAGDRTAFQALYTQYRPRMFWIAYCAVGNPILAEDVLVEAFHRAYMHLRTFDPTRGNFGTWLATITRNESRRLAQQRRWRLEEDSLERVREDGADPPSPAPSPEDLAIHNETQCRLWEAVEHLPSEQRDAIILRYREGLSYEEAAQRLGCAPQTIGTRLQRAFKRLRQILGDYNEPHDQ